MMKKAVLAALLAAAMTPLAAKPATEAIPLSEAMLELAGTHSYEFRVVAGREALCLDGVALLRGIELRNGAIAVDIAATGSRQFANLIFRARDIDNYEEAYLRLHKSRQPDAVQYSPVWNGEANWQLFPQYQAAADLSGGDWVTLRIDFAGDRALITVDGEGTTTLMIDDLALSESGTHLGLGSLMGACFSNLRVFQQPSLPPPSHSNPPVPPRGLIETWALSPSVPFTGFAERAPEPDARWSAEETEAGGLLAISRHRQKEHAAAFEQNSVDLVYAGVTLRSDRDRTVELEFDASDRARVYLDGRPLYEMDNSFRAKGPLFRGDFGLGGRKLVLPLKRGNNALVIGVAERANGWGLAARVDPEEGITIVSLLE